MPLGKSAAGLIKRVNGGHGNFAQAAAFRNWVAAHIAMRFHVLHKNWLDVGVLTKFQPWVLIAFAVLDAEGVFNAHKLVKFQEILHFRFLAGFSENIQTVARNARP